MPEPRWIAYELHDGLMQWVIGARMHMAALVAAYQEDRVNDDLESTLVQILDYLNQATEDGRQLIRFVEGLDESGMTDIVATLEMTCDLLLRKTPDGKPRLEFQPPSPLWEQRESASAWPIVRIIQQAAMNAIRHSAAELVSVQLSWTESGQMKASVIDNGHGFDPSLDYPGHVGLRSMRHRASEAGLMLDIQSSSQGTQVHLFIPS